MCKVLYLLHVLVESRHSLFWFLDLSPAISQSFWRCHWLHLKNVEENVEENMRLLDTCIYTWIYIWIWKCIHQTHLLLHVLLHVSWAHQWLQKTLWNGWRQVKNQNKPCLDGTKTWKRYKGLHSPARKVMLPFQPIKDLSVNCLTKRPKMSRRSYSSETWGVELSLRKNQKNNLKNYRYPSG